MNSLQLISKIKSKAEDIHQNIHEILNPADTLTSIEKEMLKKQCLDLYELLVKLKSDQEIKEESAASKSPYHYEPVKEAPKTVDAMPEMMDEKAEEASITSESNIVVESFKEVISWGSQSQETLDSIEHKVEIITEKTELPPPAIVEKQEHKHEHKPEYSEPISEFMVEKIVENKRIQYTVMPPAEGPKTVPLNAIVVDKEISYNEKFAQKIQPAPIPFADKTIEAPIDNLKAAINLNKKIAFVNELFKENVVEYAKAIDKINTASDRNDALRIFNELKHFYQWQNNHELVQELEKMVKRRHT